MKSSYDHTRYARQYFMPPTPSLEWTKKEYIDKAPIWCSVDLRDGNQALVIPMSLGDKLGFFKMLCDIGFKEIEIGFPAASDTEYTLCRKLIEDDRIPDDVTIQVLTQAREDIIRKTFEAIRGAKRAVVHVYNSTSRAQRELVFRKSKEEIKQIAVDGAKLLKELALESGQAENIFFEYSPESFTGTEPEYALDVCNAVLDVWQPTVDHKAIINLPVTVQHSMPHVFASQIEYVGTRLIHREAVTVSIHPHNDRGCGVADAEMGLLAGADRVEGTLFGNGERTGNVDIVTLAMNMYTQGVDSGLDFSDMQRICAAYEKYTGMTIDARSPYAGELVFAAFSGSHQDAIAKGMHYLDEHPDKAIWDVPYLPLNPLDIGRDYDADVIRINSQSGKGGVGYILEEHYGLILPKKMKAAIAMEVKKLSDTTHKELMSDEIFELFKERYEYKTDPINVTEVHFVQENGITAIVNSESGGVAVRTMASGNGRLDAVSNALKEAYGLSYELDTYAEHALEKSSSSRAIAYVGLQWPDEEITWGAALDPDIIRASIDALVTAINNHERKGE